MADEGDEIKMKRIIAVFLLLICVLGLAACNNNKDQKETISSESIAPTSGQENESEENNTEENEGDNLSKILVAYFSATGTTRPLAEYAADILNADIYEIVPQAPYTDEDLAYYTGGRADQEQNDPSARPAISGSVKDMSRYDTVLIGYPIWHGQAPKIIYTFLESYDFSGKTILPFCTSHSSGIGSSASNLHSLASGANWLDGKRFAGDTSKEEIESWLEENNIRPNEAPVSAEVGKFDFERKP